jgi:pyruvate/2-oxoglutarate/acetoin dehydrogenase E1 component
MLREITYSQAIGEALAEEMERDKNVFLLGEDIGPYGGNFGVTKGLWQRFGEWRVKDTPISESAIIGCALGAAMTGLRPVAELMFGDFIFVAMDQIANQVAKMRYMSGGQVKIPLVIRTTIGGGRSSAAQHSQSVQAYLLHTSGLKVVMPATPEDAKGLLKTSIRDENPVFFLEHKMQYNRKGTVPEEEYTIPFGKGAVRKEGTDVTVVATSACVFLALEAAEILSKEGIQLEIIDPRTIQPFDLETVVNSVMKTKHLVITDEGNETGGITAEIGMRIQLEAFDFLDAPIMRVAARDVPIPFSSPLERYVLPNTQRIIEAVKKIL